MKLLRPGRTWSLLGFGIIDPTSVAVGITSCIILHIWVTFRVEQGFEENGHVSGCEAWAWLYPLWARTGMHNCFYHDRAVRAAHRRPAW